MYPSAVHPHVFFSLASSVLKGYTTQHLPDSMSVMVESIVVKVSSSTEDPNTKVLLLSWSYQVSRELSG